MPNYYLLKFEQIHAIELVDTHRFHHGHCVKVKIGKQEFVTEKQIVTGTEARFLEEFQLEIDDDFYNSNLEIEVELFTKSRLGLVTHIGNGRVAMHHAVPRYNRYFDLQVQMYHTDRNTAHRSGQQNILESSQGKVLMKAILVDPLSGVTEDKQSMGDRAVQRGGALASAGRSFYLKNDTIGQYGGADSYQNTPNQAGSKNNIFWSSGNNSEGEERDSGLGLGDLGELGEIERERERQREKERARGARGGDSTLMRGASSFLNQLRSSHSRGHSRNPSWGENISTPAGSSNPALSRTGSGTMDTWGHSQPGMNGDLAHSGHGSHGAAGRGHPHGNGHGPNISRGHSRNPSRGSIPDPAPLGLGIGMDDGVSGEEERQRLLNLELSAALEKTRGTENALMRDLDNAERRVAELTMQREADVEKIAHLEDIIHKNAESFFRLKDDLKSAHEELHAALQLQDTGSGEKAQAEALAELQAQLEQQHREAKNTVLRIQDERDALEREVLSGREAEREYQRQITGLQTQLAAALAVAKAAAGAGRTLSQETDKETTQSGAVSVNNDWQLQDLVQENALLQKRLKEKEDDIGVLQGDLDDLYAAKYELELRLREGGAAGEGGPPGGNTADIQPLEDEIARLEEELAAQTGGAAADEAYIAELHKQLAELQGEIKNLQHTTQIIQQNFSSSYVSNTTSINTAVTTITNSTALSVTVNNIYASGDMEKVKEILFGTLIKYEIVRANNSKMIARLQKMQDRILVCARVRPPSKDEQLRGGKLCLDASDSFEVVAYDSSEQVWKAYEFDHVWDQNVSQGGLFLDIEPLLLEVATGEGINVSVISYGGAQSGKTYTLLGYGEEFGIVFRSVEKILDYLGQRKVQAEAVAQNLKENQAPAAIASADLPSIGTGSANKSQQEDNELDVLFTLHSKFDFSVAISIYEVVGEEVYDLLGGMSAKTSRFSAASTQAIRPAQSRRVALSTHISEGYAEEEEVPDLIPDLTRVPIETLTDALGVYAKRGPSQKKNPRSSPSNSALSARAESDTAAVHTIVELQVTIDKGQGEPVVSSLYLTDLASSQLLSTPSDTATSGAEAGAEARDVNLAALTEVMTYLRRGAPLSRVPFHASPLTRILQPSLNADEARCALLFTLSPTDLDYRSATAENLALAAKVHHIKLPAADSAGVMASGSGSGRRRGGGRKAAKETRMLEMNVQSLRRQVRVLKQREDALESALSETKMAAAEFSTHLQAQNAELGAKCKKVEESRDSLEKDAKLLRVSLEKAKRELGNQRQIIARLLAVAETEVKKAAAARVAVSEGEKENGGEIGIERTRTGITA